LFPCSRWQANASSGPPGRHNVVINLTVTVLIVVALFLGAGSLSAHGLLAPALRIGGLLTALTGLTIGVQTHGWVTGLDAASAAWLAAHRSAEFNLAAWLIIDIGSPAKIAATGLICAALLSRRARSMIPGVVVIGTVAGAMLVETALKAVVVQPLTPNTLSYPHAVAHSFPSGHVTGTAALLGIIAVCAGIGRRRTTRAFLGGLEVAAVLAVAVTRMYIGAHWLTDAIGGAVLAALFVTLGATVIAAFRARFGKDLARQRYSGSATNGGDVAFPQRQQVSRRGISS
jgi:undecaprenyl-diphosphatase